MAMNEPLENVFGSQKRIRWLRSHLRDGDRVLEFGCGTGCMIALPLAISSVDIVGVDLDSASIEYGQRVFAEHGVEPERLAIQRLGRSGPKYDVIIASEVLEHIETEDIPGIIELLKWRLVPGGRLLITVPNGYGWFEAEQAMWSHGLDRFIAATRFALPFDMLRMRLLGHPADDPYPNTLADEISPHVQRFTRRSIRRLLERHGFEVTEQAGSVLFAGPLTNTVFRGFGPFLSLNAFMGGLLPAIASGFYLAAHLKGHDSRLHRAVDTP